MNNDNSGVLAGGANQQSTTPTQKTPTTNSNNSNPKTGKS
jgi:hypothetical protein